MGSGANVAQAYLGRRRPGNTSEEFDLFEAYRYTHGAPEGRSNWWQAQLHKGLFDAKTEAGFTSPTVFRYCWGKPNPVTLGFVARKTSKQNQLSTAELRETLQGLPTDINWQRVEHCSPDGCS